MDSTDYRIRATAAGGQLRAIGALTTETARRAQSVHHAAPVAAAAMGRAITAALMLASDRDAKAEPFRLAMEFEGQGPLGRLVAESFNQGRARVKVQHPEVDLPPRGDGKWPVGQAVGDTGFLRVTEVVGTGEERREYQSQVTLVSGEIGDDVAHYLLKSQQVPSAVAFGVLVGTDIVVAAAGGMMVQALPDADPDVVEAVTEKLAAWNQLSHRIEAGATPESLLAAVLPEPIKWLDREPIGFGCHCSRGRSAEILATLPGEDLKILIEDRGAEVECPFCRSTYRFTEEFLARILADR